jgi:hypothetical protein
MGDVSGRWGVCVLHGGVGLSLGDVVGSQNMTCLGWV